MSGREALYPFSPFPPTSQAFPLRPTGRRASEALTLSADLSPSGQLEGERGEEVDALLAPGGDRNAPAAAERQEEDSRVGGALRRRVCGAQHAPRRDCARRWRLLEFLVHRLPPIGRVSPAHGARSSRRVAPSRLALSSRSLSSGLCLCTPKSLELPSGGCLCHRLEDASPRSKLSRCLRSPPPASFRTHQVPSLQVPPLPRTRPRCGRPVPRRFRTRTH